MSGKAIAFGKHIIPAGKRKLIPASDWDAAAEQHKRAGSLKVLNPGRDPLKVLNTNRGEKLFAAPAAVPATPAPLRKKKTGSSST